MAATQVEMAGRAAEATVGGTVVAKMEVQVVREKEAMRVTTTAATMAA